MSKVLGILAAALLTGVTVAQRDIIHWTDGTKTEKAAVQSFNLREIKFRANGRDDTRSADRVARLEVVKVKDALKRAYSSPLSERAGNFLRDAEKAVKDGDQFLAQFAYVEAARVFLTHDQAGDGFSVLEKLHSDCPNSGFLPMLYREKLDYYISRGRKSDAESVADKYYTATQTQGYPAGFQLEADYYRKIVESLGEGADLGSLRQSMQQIANRAEREYPDVASRARLTVARTYLAENDLEQARKSYQSILEAEGTPEGVLKAAWLGMGHVHLKSGSPTDREEYRSALLAFLHVYLADQTSTDPIVGEALEMGAEAARKWGGEDSGLIQNRLRGIHARTFGEK